MCGLQYLLPLANKPLLNYALEGLAASGVQETLVYCAGHAARIKEHLQKSGWVGCPVSSMTVTVVVNEDCRSTGDAMRDLDGRGLLRQDFILVRGDSVFNVNLSRFLEEHK
jgi:translation initiation factor eIF-2B subunit epsilon